MPPRRAPIRAARGGRAWDQIRADVRRIMAAMAEVLPPQLLAVIRAEAPVRTGALRDSHRIEQVEAVESGIRIRIAAGGAGAGVTYHRRVHNRDPWMARAADQNGQRLRDIVVRGWNDR